MNEPTWHPFRQRTAGPRQHDDHNGPFGAFRGRAPFHAAQPPVFLPSGMVFRPRSSLSLYPESLVPMSSPEPGPVSPGDCRVPGDFARQRHCGSPRSPRGHRSRPFRPRVQFDESDFPPLGASGHRQRLAGPDPHQCPTNTHVSNTPQVDDGCGGFRGPRFGMSDGQRMFIPRGPPLPNGYVDGAAAPPCPPPFRHRRLGPPLFRGHFHRPRLVQCQFYPVMPFPHGPPCFCPPHFGPSTACNPPGGSSMNGAVGSNGGVLEIDVTTCPVEELFRRRLFPEAAERIAADGKHADYDLATLAIPLLCSGNLQTLEKYVRKMPDLQLKLVELLEGLYTRRTPLECVIDANYDVCRPEHCTLNLRKLKKFVSHCVNNFKIDPTLVKEVHLGKCQSALIYQIKNVDFNEISLDAWLENVIILAAPFPDRLQSFCLTQILKKRNYNYLVPVLMGVWEVSFWNGVSIEKWREGFPVVCDVDSSIQYYPLNLPRDAVEFVDTKDTFEAALKVLNCDGNIVGMDCEWIGAQAGFEKIRLALLQLATMERCFLFDVITLQALDEAPDWNLMTELFQNKAVLKLGFDPHQDMAFLRPLMPGFTGGFAGHGFLDMKIAVQSLAPLLLDVFGPRQNERDANAPPVEMKFALAGIVERLFGLPLSKLECRSNWENRPLREPQVVYAALDAFCLVESYKKVKEICGERNIEFPVARPPPAPSKNQLKKLEKKNRAQLAQNATCVPEGLRHSGDSCEECPDSGISLLASESVELFDDAMGFA